MRPSSGRHECRPYVYPHVYHITHGRHFTATTHHTPPHVGAPLVTPGRPQGGNATARMHACVRHPGDMNVAPTFITRLSHATTRAAGISPLATGDRNVAPTHMPDNHDHANPHTPHKPPHVGAPLVTPGRPQGGNATTRMRPPSGRHECRPYVYHTFITRHQPARPATGVIIIYVSLRL